MANIFDSGIRPTIDEYLAKKAAEKRDYGEYWSASSAGYCQRKLIFERLGVPPIEKEGDARKQRVFEAGHVFHEWAQKITRESGLSIAQELEVQDDTLMIRGHIDDLVLVELDLNVGGVVNPDDGKMYDFQNPKHLILYDYKTQHSHAFTWQKGKPISYYHKMQTGTYLYLLRNRNLPPLTVDDLSQAGIRDLTEARILKISKDDLRMDENQILWDEELENMVVTYWTMLNRYWERKVMPVCTCDDHEGGFMAREQFNPYFYNGQPCSMEYYEKWKEENDVKF